MSNDNVAVLTTLNAAVLLIGTVQYTRLMQRTFEGALALLSDRTAEKLRLIEGKRQGVEPPIERLLELQRGSNPRLPLLPWAAGGVWFVICTTLLFSQLMMLRWIGTADAGPAPELAENSFYATAGSIVVLVVEGFVSGLVGFGRKISHLSRAHSELYSAQEMRELERQIRGATDSTSRPAPDPPTGSSGPVN